MKKQSKNLTRLLSLVLSLLMIVTVVPMSATAATNSQGYIEVRTIEELYNIRNDLTKNYILMNDIDLTEATASGGDWDSNGNGWKTIGSSSSPFSGIFDGNGYAIIGMRAVDRSGLFGSVSGEVRDLEMRDVNLSGRYQMGAISFSNSGTIANCSVSGIIKITDSNYVGGLVGENSGTISCSYNIADITSTDNAGGEEHLLGGIVGKNEKTGIIEKCYNTGDIVSAYHYSAGIAAENYGAINTCYNIGKVKYAIAYNKTSYTTCKQINCYYMAGKNTASSAGISLTEAQMLLQSMYSAFDFDEYWVMNADAVYPYPQLWGNEQDTRVIETAEIYSLPTRLIYTKGEDFDAEGLSVKFTFENAEDEYINISASEVSGYDPKAVGKQTLSFTVYRETFTFDVTVNEKPFNEIRTVEELYRVRDDLTGNYILMNDIDLTEATASGGEWDYKGYGWNPIGSNDTYSNLAFSGIFDGNGYSVKGMRISVVADNIGLFANVTGEVRNLKMSDVNVSGRYYVGAIAGSNSGTITNCSVSGAVTAYYRVGGLVGQNSGTVSYSYNLANVTSTNKYDSSNFYYLAGGIVGDNLSSGKVTHCYNTGTIKATDTRMYSCGIAGTYYSSGGSVSYCYNVGKAECSISSKCIVSNSYYLAGSGSGVTGATSLTEAQMLLQSMYPEFDFENTWVMNPNANHPYPQLKSNIQDMNESVDLIRVISYPAKLDYYTGDELNMTGGIIEAVYVSGGTDLLSITDDMISGYDPEVVGTQTLTVTFGGKTDTFEINVTKRPSVTSLTLLSEPTQKEFVIGTELDFSGAQIKVTYSNQTEETLDVTVDMTTGADINHLGEQTVTITMGRYTQTFQIKIVPASIMGITITTLPTKTSYIEGENLDLTGMTVVANYNNGLEVNIGSGYTVSGYSSTPGVHTVTVDFVGKKATFKVVVASKTLESISLNSLPTKLEYVSGEEFDPTGMVVVANYNNGSVEVINDYEISGFGTTAGIKNITVSYGGKNAYFTVKVIARVITDFKIVSLPSKLNYIEYESFDKTGLEVAVTYNDGLVKVIEDYEISGFSSKVGTHTISVSYEGYVETFTINVVGRELVDIKLVTPDKTAYIIGEEFDSTGMEVIAYYNNGQEFAIDSYEMSGFDSLSAGTKTITVSYGGFTKSFSVVVSEKSSIETNGAVKVATVKGRLGETVELPVSFSYNTGVSAFCHTINFDAKELQFVSATLLNGFAEGTLVINDEKATDGEITILCVVPQNVVESKDAYKLSFKVLETAPDGLSEVKISFDEDDIGNASGENVLFDKINGGVNVLSYWLGDLSGDRKIAMVDLLKLAQYVSGKTMTLTDKQLKAADCNEDGVINIHDVTLLSQWLLVADM